MFGPPLADERNRRYFVQNLNDPRLRRAAVSAVLKFLDEVAESAAQHASGCSAAKETTQSARDHVGKSATGPTARRCPTWHTTRPAAQQPAENIAEPAARSARILRGKGSGPSRAARIGSLTAAALESVSAKGVSDRGGG
jgi:hypothetical protein